MLPEEVCLFRGWGSDPMSMMCGLDETFDGVFFTGYHSGVGMDCNPLSHTMNTQNTAVLINGEPASELMINSITAATLGVPVLLVTGDQGLCHWMKQQNPNVETVPVSRGVGRGSISIHPDKAIRLIQEAARSGPCPVGRGMHVPAAALFSGGNRLPGTRPGQAGKSLPRLRPDRAHEGGL